MNDYMRYCNKTKNIIETSYKSATIDEIVNIINNAGLTKRSKNNIKKYIDILVERDLKRELRRSKLEDWALKNPIRYRSRTLVNGAKSRAKKKGIPFNLTVAWVEQKLRNGVCEISNIPFYIKPYSRKENYVSVHPHSPSLDQICPSQGYTMDNVQVVCDQVNKFKGDRHITSAVNIARELIKTYEQRSKPVVILK